MATNNLYNSTFYEGQFEGSLTSASHFFDILFQYYKPNSVVDFGCGIGAWLSVVEKYGVGNLTGLDGEWVNNSELLSNNITFIPTNFEVNQPIVAKSDLAISVEVAEHLEEEYADNFISSICSSAPVVIFGAAIKEQGGKNHVNEQPQSYWIQKFENENFLCLDIFRSKLWNIHEVETWYKQNTFLFVHKDSLHLFPKDIQEAEPELINVVHPELLNTKLRYKYEPEKADKLRDAALSIENEDIILALSLMRKAREARPEGKMIRKKITDYLNIISNQNKIT
jgi:hypothetical protein